MMDTHPTGAPWRNFYGRMKGKTLRDSQKRYLEDLDRVGLPGVDWVANPDRTALDMKALFGDRPVWLEVGFGSGEHLVHQASSNRDIGFIGAEPFINGVATCLGKMREHQIDNVRLHPGDARDLFDVLPPECLSRAFLLYPDPWPKARHHRRRFVTDEHLGPLHRALKPGAIFRVATDIPDYVRQTMEEVPRARFKWLGERAQDWREPWADWIRTRYEAKAIREGRRPHYMTFERI